MKMLLLRNEKTLVDIMIVMVENTMELSHKIREIINDVTQSKYTGDIDLKVESLGKDNLYTLKLSITSKEVPVVFGFQGSEDVFLKYIAQEIYRKKLHLIQRTTTSLINNDATSQSSKNKKANELNIPIITERDFLTMIGE